MRLPFSMNSCPLSDDEFAPFNSSKIGCCALLVQEQQRPVGFLHLPELGNHYGLVFHPRRRESYIVRIETRLFRVGILLLERIVRHHVNDKAAHRVGAVVLFGIGIYQNGVRDSGCA
jgi:hypothetical protein